MSSNLVRVKDAAARLALHPLTIYSLLKRGELRCDAHRAERAPYGIGARSLRCRAYSDGVEGVSALRTLVKRALPLVEPCSRHASRSERLRCTAAEVRMSAALYDEAKAIILADLPHFFPDGEERSGEWWWRRRPDDHTPSCHAAGDGGACKDFGDDSFRGSVLDCYAELNGLNAKEAAKRIAPDAKQHEKQRPYTSRSKEKAKPVLPVPTEALAQLNCYIKSEWAVEHYGEPVLGSKYRDAEGRVLFCVARYEKAGKKSIRPYYFGEDGKWHEGQAMDSDRPLLHLPEILACILPVLVVEGERCGSVEVPGFIVTTWAAAVVPWTRRTGARSRTAKWWCGPTSTPLASRPRQ